MKYMGPKYWKESRGGVRVVAVVMWVIIIGIIVKAIIRWLF